MLTNADVCPSVQTPEPPSGRLEYIAMFETLKSMLVDELQIDEASITPEAELSADLGINSIELANLVMLCEEKFGITIDDEDIHKFITVGDVAAFLEAHKA